MANLVFLEFYPVFSVSNIKPTIGLFGNKYSINRRITMRDYWSRDSRIDDDSAMRDLEKKVHFLMAQIAGMVQDAGSNNINVPDDINADALDVFLTAPKS
jgi:hypothetical protein